MSTDHNRIKVADLEKNQQNKILATNNSGEIEFTDINTIKIDSYNALDYALAGKALDARQGKVLKDLIDNINTLLASDNINLNTLQELVDAIEVVQNSLNTILVNDLTSGGTTKALTAEMGKALQSNKVDKVSGKSLLSDTEIARLGTLSNYTHPANHPASIITQDPSNRFVTDTEKANWNSKADLLSPSFTGIPTATTAVVGTNTTQIATTAFVTTATSGISNKAVLLTGNQTKTGILSFDNGPNPSLINGIRTNSGENANSIGAMFDAIGGTAVTSTVGISCTGYKIDTEGIDGILINSKSLSLAGSGIKVNGATGSNAFLYRGQNNGVDTYTVNKTGDIVANTFTGGAALTGLPTAPTAVAGTNTTQIATTAFVTTAASGISNKAVLLTGNQTKTGILSFDNGPNPSLINGIRTNSGANTNSIGAMFDATGGTAVTSSIGISCTGYKIDTEGIDGILINSKSLSMAGSGIKVNGATGSYALLYRGQNNGVDTYTVNKTGDIVANTFTGGAALTGVPTAPTAVAGTNTNQIATTAFVLAASGGGSSSSGSFIPTLTPALNCSSMILKSATYTKVGDIVTVMVTANGTVTTASTTTFLDISLPVNRAGTTSLTCGYGSLFARTNITPYWGEIQIQPGQKARLITFSPPNITGDNFVFIASFQYNVNE